MRELSRMTPRFLDRTVARQQSDGSKGVGKGWDMLSLAIVIMPCLQNIGCPRVIASLKRLYSAVKR